MQSEKSSISARFYWKFWLDRKASLCQDDDLALCVSSYLQSTGKEKYGCVSLVLDIISSTSLVVQWSFVDCQYVFRYYTIDPKHSLAYDA